MKNILILVFLFSLQRGNADQSIEEILPPRLIDVIGAYANVPLRSIVLEPAFNEKDELIQVNPVDLDPVSLSECLGKGSVKSVYCASLAGKQVAAFKLKLKSRMGVYASKIQQYLSSLPSISGIVKSYGVSFDARGDKAIHYIQYFNHKDLDLYRGKKNPFSWVDFMNLSKQLCKTIVKMHEKNIIHRDIKLENILVSTSENGLEFALGDFDFAFHYGDSIIHHLSFDPIAGTEQVMAPYYYRSSRLSELLQVKDSEALTLYKKNDYWGFGMVLFNIVFGPMPWENAPNRVTQEKLNIAMEKLRKTLEVGRIDASSMNWIDEILKCSMDLRGDSSCNFAEICAK